MKGDAWPRAEGREGKIHGKLTEEGKHTAGGGGGEGGQMARGGGCGKANKQLKRYLLELVGSGGNQPKLRVTKTT